MESLFFAFGTIAGGVIALVVMAMLFVAKSADEGEGAVTGYCPSHKPQQESREDLEPMIPCPVSTAGQKL